MRSIVWLVVVALCIPIVAGCSGSSSAADTAEDKSFQEGLAKASDANKGVPQKSNSSMGKLPPALAGKVAPPPAQTGK
jgi:hypothetical protein